MAGKCRGGSFTGFRDLQRVGASRCSLMRIGVPVGLVQRRSDSLCADPL